MGGTQPVYVFMNHWIGTSRPSANQAVLEYPITLSSGTNLSCIKNLTHICNPWACKQSGMIFLQFLQYERPQTLAMRNEYTHSYIVQCGHRCCGTTTYNCHCIELFCLSDFLAYDKWQWTSKGSTVTGWAIGLRGCLRGTHTCPTMKAEVAKRLKLLL